MTEDTFSNENITVSQGPLWLVELVFKAFELNTFLDTLKRDQGVKFSTITKALVAYGIQSRGLSVLDLKNLASDQLMKELFGLPLETTLNDLYRTMAKAGNACTFSQRVDAILFNAMPVIVLDLCPLTARHALDL